MPEFFQHEKALISPGARIAKGTRVWAFANIQEGAVIGEGCNICDGCFVENGAVVGNNVTLKNGVYVFQGVTLEDNVFCGANTAFINDRYPRSRRNDLWALEKVLVKKGATIGCNASILCGITIGEYGLIGAGSVVTGDVPGHGIIFGNPGRLHGYACCCGKKLNDAFVCECGMSYVMRDQELVKKDG